MKLRPKDHGTTTMSENSDFSTRVRAEFLDYIHQNPSSRRISREDRDTFIEWIRNPSATSSSQQEASRKHYVRKNFTWDGGKDLLRASPTTTQSAARPIATIEEIADVVGTVHVNNAHAGWDATWKCVSTSCYGILRADVVFLLKRCDTCALDPRKRPKADRNHVRPQSSTGNSGVSPCSLDDLLHDEPVDN